MTDIFVNLPVSDLDRAKAFYLALGTEINPLFTDDNAACVVWSEHIYFMILTREYFASFTDREVADPRKAYSALLSISRPSREAVDEIVEKGVAAGGTQGETQDYGFMYSRDLFDLDGNGIQMMWMDPVAAEQGPEAFMAQQGSPDSQG